MVILLFFSRVFSPTWTVSPCPPATSVAPRPHIYNLTVIWPPSYVQCTTADSAALMLMEGSRLRVVPLLQMFLFTEAKAIVLPSGAGLPAAGTGGASVGGGGELLRHHRPPPSLLTGCDGGGERAGAAGRVNTS